MKEIKWKKHIGDTYKLSIQPLIEASIFYSPYPEEDFYSAVVNKHRLKKNFETSGEAQEAVIKFIRRHAEELLREIKISELTVK